MSEEEDNGSPRLFDIENEMDNLRGHVKGLMIKIEKKKNDLQTFVSLIKTEQHAYEKILPKTVSVDNSLFESGSGKTEFETFKTKLRERQKEISNKLPRLNQLLEEIIEEEPKIRDFGDKVHVLYQEDASEDIEREVEKLKKENDEWWNEIRGRFKESKKLRISLLKGKDEDLVQEFTSWEKGSSLLKEAKTKLFQIKEELKTQSEMVDVLKDKVKTLESRAADPDNREELKTLASKLENEEKERANQEKQIDSYRQLLEETKKLVESLELRSAALAEDVTEGHKKSTELQSKINKMENQLEEEKKHNSDANSLVGKLQEKLQKEKEENEEWLKLVEVLKSKLSREEATNKKIDEENKSLKDKVSELGIREAELEKCKNEIKQLLTKLDNGEKEKFTIEKNIENYKKLLEDSKELVSTLEIRNSTLTEDVAEENKKSTELRLQINQLENQLDEKKETIRDKENEIEKLHESLEKEMDERMMWMSEVGVLKGKITKEEAFNKEIASLKEEMENKERKIEDIRQDLEKTHEKQKETEKALVEKERELEDTAEKLERLEDALESEKLVKEEYAIKCEMLENKVALAQSENKELTNAAAIQENAFKQERKKINELQDEIGSQKETIKGLKDEVTSLRTRATELEERTKEIKKLETILENEEKEKTSLERHVYNYKQMLEESKKLISKMEQRNDALSKDIEEENMRSTELRLQINQLESQLNEEKEFTRDQQNTIEKLQELLENEKDESIMWMREVDVLKGKITKEEAFNKEIASLQEGLESKERKIEDIRQDLEKTHDKQKETEKALVEKERELEDTAEKLERSEDAYESEKLVKDEYTIKCEMLEHRIVLLESENKELGNVAATQENTLQQEKEKVKELQREVDEAKIKNKDFQSEINELNEQLLAAEAYDKYNQAIKSQSLEKLKSAEEENQKLLEMIDNLKENITEKEKGIQELVERYAIEEQKLKLEINNVTRELQIFKNDCITKSQVIDDLREQLDDGSPDKEPGNTMIELEALRERNKEMGARVASLETDLIKERERNEKFEETILELNTRYDEAEEKYETFDREASEELDRKDAQIEDLTRKLEEEQDKSDQLELQVENLKEIEEISKELSDSKGLDERKAGLLKNRMKAVKEEFQRNEIRRRDENIAQLEEELERMNDQLRDEQCESAEKDEIISDFKETGLKDRLTITEYSEEIKSLKEQNRAQNQHIEELTEKVLENQILVMDLQSEAESERSRAATIEELLTAEKGRYFHQITIVHDLKKKVEEYQSTVGEIKSKVDRINRHLRCLPQAALDGSKSVSSEDLSARKVSQRLTSQRLSLKDIKTTVATVEGKHEQLMQEVQEETAKNADQDERIEELVQKTEEYDAIMDEMKVELDNIKKRYEDIAYRLHCQDEVDSFLSEKEKDCTKALMEELRKQLSHFEDMFKRIFVKEARRIDAVNEKLRKMMSKVLAFVRNLKNQKIKSYEGVIDRMSKDLEEERKLNADLTERVIKELEDNFKENQQKLREVSKKADENERKRQEMSRQFSNEKDEQEFRIKELIEMVNESKEVLHDLKVNLEKEQETVFELTEELTIERSYVSEKNISIEELKLNLTKEREICQTLKFSLEEESERALQLSAALTAEQVKGVQREDKIKTAEDLIKQLQKRIEDNEEKARELNEELNDTRNQNNQLAKLVEEEVVLCSQTRESLRAEQVTKAKYERETTHLLQVNAELRLEVEQEKIILHDIEDKLREMEQEKSHRENLIEALKTALESEGQNYSILAARFETEESQKTELESKLKETEKKLQGEIKTVVQIREKEKKTKEDEMEELMKRLDREQARLSELLEEEKLRSYQLDMILKEERRRIIDKDKVLSDMLEQLAEEKSRSEELEEMVCQLQKKVSDNKMLVETLIEQNERDSEEKKERDARSDELEILLEEWKKKFMEQNQEVELLRGVYLHNEELKNDLQILTREKDKYHHGCEHAEKVLYELELHCSEQGKEIEYEKSRYKQLKSDLEQKEYKMAENDNELTELRQCLSSREEDIQMATTRVENLKQNLDLIKTESEEKAKALKQKEKVLRKAGKKITEDIQIVGAIKRDLEQRLAERELKVQKLEKSVELLKRLYLATKTELKRLEAAEKARMRRKNNQKNKENGDEEGEIVMKDVQEKITELTEEIQYKESAVQSLEEDVRESKNLKYVDKKELKRKENLLTVFSTQLSEQIKQKARQERLLISLRQLYGEELPQESNITLAWAKEEAESQSKEMLDSNLGSVNEEPVLKSSTKYYQESSFGNNSNKLSSKGPVLKVGSSVEEEESILEELKSTMDEPKLPISEKIAVVETISVQCPLPAGYEIFQTVDGYSDDSDLEMGDDDVFEDNPISEEFVKDIPEKTKDAPSKGSDGQQPEDKIPDLQGMNSSKKCEKIILYIILALLIILLPHFLSSKLVGVVLTSTVLPAAFLMSRYVEKQQRMEIENFLRSRESRLAGNNGSKIRLLQEELAQKKKENERQQDTIEEMQLQIETDVKLIEQIKEQLEEEIAEKELKMNIFGGKESEEDLDDLQKVVEMLERRLSEAEKAKLEEDEKNQVTWKEYQELRNNIEKMRQEREAIKNQQQTKYQKAEVKIATNDIPRVYKINLPIFAFPIVVGVALGLFHYTSQVSFLLVQGTFCFIVLFAVNIWMSMKRIKNTLLEERKELQLQNEELDDILEVLDREYEVVKAQKTAIDSLVKELDEEQVNRKAKQKELAKLIWELQEMEGMKKCIPKQTDGAKQDLDLHSKIKKIAKEKALERAQFYSNMITRLQKIGSEDEDDEVLVDDLCDAAKELSVHAENTMKDVRQIKETLTEEDKKESKQKFSLKSIALGVINAVALVASLVYKSRFIFGSVIAVEALIFLLVKLRSQAESRQISKLKSKLEQQIKHNKIQKAENEKLKKLLSTEKKYKRSDEFAMEVKRRRLKKTVST